MPSQDTRRPIPVPGHPGLYQKGNRIIDTWKERGKSRSRSYPTVTAAARGRAQRIAADNRVGSRERFDRYARAWIETYTGRTKRGIDEDTRNEYRAIIENWLVPYFRHTPLGDIGPKAVRDFIAHLGKQNAQASGDPLAPATIRWIMAPLKAMLAEAYETELVTVDASRVRIVIPGQSRRRPEPPKAMTRQQLTAVMGVLPARYQLLFLILSYTGLRISEALGLQWRDLEQTPAGPVLVIRRQFYRGRLKDYPKTEAGDRLVAVTPALARELTRHRTSSDYSAPGDPIISTRVGTHVSAHNIRRRLRPLVAELGLAWVTPHVFRHSLATFLRNAGHDAHAIAAVLGHADPSFTQRTYIHQADVVRFDDLFAAEDNLEDNHQAENRGIGGNEA